MRALRHDYPCALAVYLVAQGIYGYQGGDYWSEVIQVTGPKRARLQPSILQVQYADMSAAE